LCILGERQSSLGNDTLKDLLIVHTDGISMDLNQDPSIDLWWKAKTRQPGQRKRKTNTRKGQSVKMNIETDSSDQSDDIFCWTTRTTG